MNYRVFYEGKKSISNGNIKRRNTNYIRLHHIIFTLNHVKLRVVWNITATFVTKDYIPQPTSICK